MGNSCYECSDFHCDLDLSLGPHAKQQAHEASGAHQAGSFGHEPVPASLPIRPLSAHNFRGGLPYISGAHPALNMFSSSSHRHSADVIKAREARAAAERETYQEVWEHIGHEADQEFRHWESQCTAGYLSQFLEIELRVLLARAVKAKGEWDAIPIQDHDLNEEAARRYFSLLQEVRDHIKKMVEDQRDWLMDQAGFPVLN